MKSTRKIKRFNPDKPIQSKQHDLLNRAKFAARLADEIHAWDGSESLVVGLYGAWGMGKSSLKNMILEANQRKGRLPLSVMEFNPWQLSGTGSIPDSFFSELGVLLGETGCPEEIDKRVRTLNAYAKGLGYSGFVAKNLAKLMACFGVPASPIVEGVGTGLENFGVTFEQGGQALAAQSDALKRSLCDQKKELAEQLSSLERPVLIVIDDIDRLTTDEILQVFQLVKANADFPNIIYLLLFERSIVANALDKISGNRGDEFMEKIVQVGFHIPQPAIRDIQKVLFSGLDKYVEKPALARYWNKRRWQHLYSDGIDRYFRTLRHVYRYLASFEFHVKGHSAANSSEVNPIDLIALETLRVFEPALYESIPSAKVTFTRYVKGDYFNDIKQDEIEETLTILLSKVKSENRENVRNILAVIFPPITSFYENRDAVLREHDDWLRELRACHPDHFEKYFTLAIADDDISQLEMDRILQILGNQSELLTAFRSLERRRLLETAIERLDAYKGKIPLENLSALVGALCDVCDGLAEDKTTLFSQSTLSHAWRICYFALQRESDFERRFGFIKSAFASSKGLQLPFELVALDLRHKHRSADVRYLFSEDHLEKLKDTCLIKFSHLGEAVLEWDRRFRVVFMRWSWWENDGKIRRFGESYINSTKEALWLLTMLLDESHSHGQDHRVSYSISLKPVERFIQIERMTGLLEQADQESLNKLQKTAIREFYKAIERRRKGEPDDLRRTRDDPDEEIVE